jgi:cytochrome P450
MILMGRLAMMEMRMLLAYFVWHFDAELVHPEEPVYEDIFIATRGPLELRVKPARVES